MVGAALSCFAIPAKLSKLSISCSALSMTNSSSSPNYLNFYSSSSMDFARKGSLSWIQKGFSSRLAIVCEAATQKKADSAVKRARQAEKRRLYNRSRKSEIRTRMKKVLEALEKLRKKGGAQAEEIVPIEKLIGEAYSAIDKAVRVGTLHRNTGARRKSRLARKKKAVEIHHGWYTPAAASA